MTTYSKETALYDTGAIATDIGTAGETASKYITAVGNDGIKVHPYNETTQTVDSKNYTKINAEGMEIHQNVNNTDKTVASFGASGAQIGMTGETHIEMNYNSMQLKDMNGTAFFYISDLRDKNDANQATITEIFEGDGSTTQFTVQLSVSAEVSATDSSHGSNTVTRSSKVYTFATAPSEGAVVTIVYKTTDDRAKAYTLGQRKTGQVGAMSMAEGYNTTASGLMSHAEGYNTTASGGRSHAEGQGAKASGNYSHAEGNGTTAKGAASHTEGLTTTASGNYSHAEGFTTTASGNASHAEGNGAKASGGMSHAEGFGTTASGYISHAGGYYTIASKFYQTAIGKYNIEDTTTADEDQQAFIIGNGTGANARSNALTVDWHGDVTLKNHSSSIGTIVKHEPSAVSCANNYYRQLAYITLDPGVWLISGNAIFPYNNTTGVRRVYVSTATSNYDNVTTAPAAWGNNMYNQVPVTGSYQAFVHTNSTPVNVSSTTTFRLIGWQNSGSSVSVTGRFYAVRIV